MTGTGQAEEESSKDKAGIRALQLGYAETFDARDAESYVALFTEDASVVQPDGKRFGGHNKLRKAVLNMPPPNGGYHRIGKANIRVDGDCAEGRCAFVARRADGRIATGHYEDSYRRENSGWKIASRKVVIERWLETEETADNR